MKKVLLAFDNGHFSTGAFEFACWLNEQAPILLTGVFLPHLDFTSTLSYAQGGAGTFLPVIEDYNAEVVAQQAQAFETACTRHHIEFRIHKDRYDFAIPELKKETRFADLLVLGSEKFYSNLELSIPNEYLRMALHDAECPVVLVPEAFRIPECNVLCYDGSEDAVLAIKNFSSLFPQLCSNETVLVYATDKKQPEIPDIDYIKELAARHFPNLTLQVLDVAPKKYFDTWLDDVKNPILISGSYGRSGLSQTFRQSFITEVIAEHRIPVFIAHH
ncbi:MAG TPA: hypothetical protein VFS25_25155 [Chitinophaga sp.]|uniref:hypothetical protein n=1 Tax=Chitinophaga sp. TaxID=1869181 RepID=UPI002DB6B720|nr:hypothetical protein [Chitinophaga sp.]HEU4556160.1 hypothetical protein [Chitinophaga sp.]